MRRTLFVLCIAALLVSRVFAAHARAAQSSAADPASTDATQNRESWTSIDLAKSGLPLGPPPAMLLDKSELAGGCSRELLRLQWRPSDPIDLYVIRPLSTGKVPVVLFLYNYSLDTTVFQDARWCARSVDNHYAIVGFASALSWPRLHAPRPMKEWFVSELQEALATSTHDVQMILNYLESRRDLDVHRAGIFGQGSGGAVAILAAAADRRIAALDLMDPWGDWPDWLKSSAQIPEEERAAYLRPEFVAGVSGLDPVRFLPQLKDRALHIQQTASDPVTPITAREKIASATPNRESIHLYSTRADEVQALGADGIVRWFGAELRIADGR